jgi:hypothetical protein
MALPEIRRLAAVDMHGARGTSFRRRLIVAEFVLGAAVGTALGLWVALSAAGAGWLLLGAWVAGASLNYVPLAAHALELSRAGRLESELAGADIHAELRHYTRVQFWIAVPLLFVVLAPLQLRARARRG